MLNIKKGNKIHIKKSHEGRFTDYCNGKVTEECIQRGKNSPNPKIRKMATFAQNARVWKHALGGKSKTQQELEANSTVLYKATKPDYGDDTTTTDVPEMSWSSVMDQISNLPTQEERIKQAWEDEDVEDVSFETSGSKPYKYTPRNADTSTKASYKQIIDYFMNRLSLTKEQAAAIAGVFYAESGLKPDAVNKAEEKLYGRQVAGGGIAQLTGGRNQSFRQWEKENKGRDVGPAEAGLDDQLEFIAYEMENRPVFLNMLRNTTDIEHATDIVFRGYENGSENQLATREQMIDTYTKAWKKTYGDSRKYDYDNELTLRTDYANDALNFYNN